MTDLGTFQIFLDIKNIAKENPPKSPFSKGELASEKCIDNLYPFI